jgi:galactokinase
LSLISLNFDKRITCSLDNLVYNKEDDWANYPKGVSKILLDAGYKIKGANLLYYGTIPIASGLSSSASIEVVTAYGLCVLSKIKIDKLNIALLSQKAENEFVGMKCGIMDQFVITSGKKDNALFLDCRTLEYKHIPLKLRDIVIIISNTKVKRGLVDSEYNKRRQECEDGVKILNKYNKKIKQLRDVEITFFEKYKYELPENIRKRCEHIIYENERVKSAVICLDRDKIDEFGKLINQSHVSLRDLYEVSCKELDILVEEALKINGTIGSRMTGAGFGGCTVSLVKKEAVDSFITQVGKQYKIRTGIEPEFYVSISDDGVKELGEGI